MITYQDKRVIKDNYRLVRDNDHRFTLFFDADRCNSVKILEFNDEDQELKVYTSSPIITHTPPSQDTNLVDRYIHKFTINPFEGKI